MARNCAGSANVWAMTLSTTILRMPGTYTVNRDCTGSKIFGGATTYDFVVTPDGREITWIVTNAYGGPLFTGRAVRMDNVGDLQVTKDCSAYTGAAGAYCTVTASNLATIKVGSKFFYDQAAGTPPGMLDSAISSTRGPVIARSAIAHSIWRPIADYARFRAGPDSSPGSVPV
jgi:hypothetical protein